MIVAVIPARGGSKRIPRKNIKPFAGKPIIAYSIEAALESKLFDRVIVSTDDDEIAAVARNWGAEVPFRRPAELSDEYAGTSVVVAHAVSWLAEQGQAPEFICCIYATAPFLDPADLCQGLDLLREKSRNFAFSATEYAFPIQRAFKMMPDGNIAPFDESAMEKRSQDLEAAYHDAAQFYWGTAQAFIRGLPIFSMHSVPVILPRYRVIDIDTMEDWIQAELMHAVLKRSESALASLKSV
jgi:pseudaminic acid cytidylyltransferase